MVASSVFQSGDWVEIKSKEEILLTLDKSGQLDGLPFMPEMFAYCGQRLRVSKRAHKTCDPPSGLQARGMKSAVHLEGIRCDGSAHGGCQQGCLIFWKDAWLKAASRSNDSTKSDLPSMAAAGCREQDVFAATKSQGSGPDDPTYVCQNTRLYHATTSLPWWKPGQYIEDLTSGNVRPGQMVAAFAFFLYHSVTQAGIGLGSPLRYLYDRFQKLRGGTPYPWRKGKIRRGAKTPSFKLDLQPGEAVKVKSYPKILETLDQDWKNRGMYFDAELVPFCNETHTVLTRVERIIDEKSGKMVRLKTDAVILKDVACEARYAKCRRFCPRAIYPYWREIWLERAE